MGIPRPRGNWPLLHGYAPALITPLRRSLRKVGPGAWWGGAAHTGGKMIIKMHLSVLWVPMDPLEHGQCSIRKNFLREIVIFLKISWFLGFHFTILLHACMRQKKQNRSQYKITFVTRVIVVFITVISRGASDWPLDDRYWTTMSRMWRRSWRLTLVYLKYYKKYWRSFVNLL